MFWFQRLCPQGGARSRSAELLHRANAIEFAVLASRNRHDADCSLTATWVTNGGRSAWLLDVLLLDVYLIFALTLYLMPPPV